MIERLETDTCLCEYLFGNRPRKLYLGIDNKCGAYTPAEIVDGVKEIIRKSRLPYGKELAALRSNCGSLAPLSLVQAAASRRLSGTAPLTRQLH